MKTMQFGLSVVGLMAMSATSAMADDGKAFPGSMCSFERKDAEQVAERYSGRLKNKYPGTRRATCPIVRDMTDWHNIEYALVFVGDSVNRCYIQMRNPDRTFASWSGRLVHSGSTRFVDFFAGSATGDSHTNSVLFLVCDLPQNGVIYGYLFADDT